MPKSKPIHCKGRDRTKTLCGQVDITDRLDQVSYRNSDAVTCEICQSLICRIAEGDYWSDVRIDNNGVR